MRSAWRWIGLVACVVVPVGCGEADAPGQDAASPGAQLTARKTYYRPPGANSASEDMISIDLANREQRTILGASRGGARPLSGASWAADGESFVFLGGRRKTDEGFRRLGIYSARADGTGIRRLIQMPNIFTPVLSPDGQTIAFARGRLTNRFYGSTVWLIQSDGTGLRRLTQWRNLVLDQPSSFTSDGSQVAFTRNKCNRILMCTSAARTLALDVSSGRLLAQRAEAPVFSPDGRQVAFVSNRDRNGQITTGSDTEDFAAELYVMNADGSGKTRLTRTRDRDEETPSWDPSGRRIAFAQVADRFQSRVMQINPDGSCMRVLLKNRPHKRDFDFPAWRPGSDRGADKITC
jgi:Tol biopolymer transport system component